MGALTLGDALHDGWAIQRLLAVSSNYEMYQDWQFHFESAHDTASDASTRNQNLSPHREDFFRTEADVEDPALSVAANGEDSTDDEASEPSLM